MKIVITRREALSVPDGINIFIFSLADELIRNGHKVIVVSNLFSDTKKIKDFFELDHYPEIISMGVPKEMGYIKSVVTWLLKGKKLINKLSPDLVIVNGAIPISFNALSCTVSHDLERRLPYLWKMRMWYKRFAYRKSRYIVVTCSELKVKLAKELSVNTDKIQVIPTCINLNGYIRKPLTERENAILHMGTVDYKNPLTTIKAFNLLEAESAENIKLYITGKINRRLINFILKLRPCVQKKIKLLGYISAERLKELIGSVKIVSVPSNYFVPVASPTVIESFASGTPVVGSLSISRDILVDGYNGYSCDTRKEGGFASSFSNLLNDEKVWLNMSCNAIESCKKFSAKNIADLYLGLLGR